MLTGTISGTRHEPNVGYASSAQADNAFGVTSDLNLVRAEPFGEETLVTWEVDYEADDLPMMRAEYDDAFADIAERLNCTVRWACHRTHGRRPR